ncbi:hypothetical protein EVG20_g6618 [Dentipellis fragilis]|uniref:Uncharacterized protein n=1 Tax=Dentipellis fragilis TaxID=205917 RepID=A0A4Y9YLJ3_9AGAM|nr:hypothetical protein EVG20_g6618 [Dentipellis fragilis]
MPPGLQGLMVDPNITLERSLYIGNALGLILYGFQVLMYFQTVYLLCAKRSNRLKMQRFSIIYGGIMLAILTFVVVKNVVFGEDAWIEHRAHMDPAVFIAKHASTWWYSTLGSIAVMAMSFMGDGLLVGSIALSIGRRRLTFSSFIVATLSGAVVSGSWCSLASFISRLSVSRLLISYDLLVDENCSSVVSVVYAINGALPGSTPYTRSSMKLAIAWISLSASVNVILTTLISVRLLMMRNLVRSILPAQVGAKYTSIAAIFVESALPLSLLGIGLIVTYVLDSPVQMAFSLIWGVFCAVSPQLVILRVAMGAGWSKEMVSQVTHPVGSNIRFVTPCESGPHTVHARSGSSTLCLAARDSKSGKLPDLELEQV